MTIEMTPADHGAQAARRDAQVATDLIMQEEALIEQLHRREDRFWSARGLDATERAQAKVRETMCALQMVRKQYRLRHSETLVFYDGPELFVAYDQVDRAYVCLLVEVMEEFDRYLCVPVSRRRLADLVNSEMDLRFVLNSSETGESYEGRVLGSDFEQFEIQPLLNGNPPEAWLPEEGFFVEPGSVSEDRVAAEARAKNQAVIQMEDEQLRQEAS